MTLVRYSHSLSLARLSSVMASSEDKEKSGGPSAASSAAWSLLW